jgi:hypothetical protein
MAKRYERLTPAQIPVRCLEACGPDKPKLCAGRFKRVLLETVASACFASAKTDSEQLSRRERASYVTCAAMS